MNNLANIHSMIVCLADGQWHSGQELAEQLGVSRTAVWKRLSGLADVGLSVERVKGKGYHLTRRLDLLDESYIKQCLSACATQYFALPEFFLSIDSSNTQAQRVLAPGYVCVAEHQTQGRGRRGRYWQTPLASQITLSAVVEFQSGIAATSGLSLVVGLSVAKAIEQTIGVSLQLKWPNDLLFRMKKVGGILLEVHGDIAGPCQVVIGIGVNIDMPAETDIDQSWTDLTTAAKTRVSRNALLVAILDQLAQVLSDYEQTGFAYYQQAWIARDAFYQQAVTLEQEGSVSQGVAMGVNDQGQLLLETTAGIKSVVGGDVSLRLAGD